MNGYILLNGNIITEAGLDAPTSGWTANHAPVPSMAVEPSTLIGAFYDPKSRRAYDTYEPRSGRYSSSLDVTEADIKDTNIKNAENLVEIKACNWMIQSLNTIIEYGQPITGALVRTNLSLVTNQLDNYLGTDNWTLTDE